MKALIERSMSGYHSECTHWALSMSSCIWLAYSVRSKNIDQAGARVHWMLKWAIIVIASIGNDGLIRDLIGQWE